MSPALALFVRTVPIVPVVMHVSVPVMLAVTVTVLVVLRQRGVTHRTARRQCGTPTSSPCGGCCGRRRSVMGPGATAAAAATAAAVAVANWPRSTRMRAGVLMITAAEAAGPVSRRRGPGRRCSGRTGTDSGRRRIWRSPAPVSFVGLGGQQPIRANSSRHGISSSSARLCTRGQGRRC